MPVVDPGDYSVKDLRDIVAGMDDEDALEEILELEKATDDRKTAKQRIEARLNSIRDDDGSDETVPSEAAETAAESVESDTTQDTSDDNDDESADEGTVSGPAPEDRNYGAHMGMERR